MNGRRAFLRKVSQPKKEKLDLFSEFYSFL